MKIYSWKTLISTILIGGALIIYQIKRIMAGDSLSYLYLLLWIYLIFEGLLVSFTREGYGEDCFSKWYTLELLGNFLAHGHLLLAG